MAVGKENQRYSVTMSQELAQRIMKSAGGSPMSEAIRSALEQHYAGQKTDLAVVTQLVENVQQRLNDMQQGLTRLVGAVEQIEQLVQAASPAPQQPTAAVPMATYEQMYGPMEPPAEAPVVRATPVEDKRSWWRP